MDNKQERYDDIIDLPRHVSPVHPPMPMADRAAQFSPFAALQGYEDAVMEAGRLVDRKAELSEDAKEDLDKSLRFLLKRITHHPEVAVSYFRPDERKDGGKYVTITGKVEAIDTDGRILVLEGGVEIPVEEIREIETIVNSGKNLSI